MLRSKRSQFMRDRCALLYASSSADANNMDVEKLIELVYSKEAIWNRDSDKHNSPKHIDTLWDEVCAEMGQDKKALKVKWKYLRDLYRKNLTKWQSHSLKHNKPMYDPSWTHFKSLWFLKDQLRLKPEMQSTNSSPSTSDSNNILYIKEEIYDPDFDESFSEASAETESEKVAEFDSEAKIEFDDNVNVKGVNKKRKLDADECFLQSLLPHFKEMDSKRKLLCQIEVQKIIMEYAYNYKS